MNLSPKEQFDLQRLRPEDVGAQPRSAEAFDFWFDKSRYARDWGKVEARFRVARLAIPENRRTILQRFIDRKPSRVDFTTAHVAAVLDSSEVLKLSLDRKDDLAKLWERRTCLGLAAEMGHVDMVRALIDAGAPRSVPGSLDPLLLGKNHPAVVELLAGDGLSPEQLHALLRSAAQKGDRAEVERLASQLGEVPPDLFLNCSDETTAVYVLELLPQLAADRVCGLRGGESSVLAKALIARGEIRAQDIASHAARMDEEGLLLLIEACPKPGARLGEGAPARSLIDVVAARSKLRVVKALEARGQTITAKTRARLLEDESVSPELRRHLLDFSTLSHVEFLRAPAAEGFAGRFADQRFFGVRIGDPAPEGALPDVRLFDRDGVVTEVRYERYGIPGDAFEAISEALSKEHGTPVVQEPQHHVWTHGGLHIALRCEMRDVGSFTSLVVRREVGPSATSPEALAAAFQGAFPEFESVEFRPKGTGFEVVAELPESDDGILLSWPTNPMVGDAFDPQFVDAVLVEMRSTD